MRVKKDHGLEPVLTVAEVCEALNISRATVYSMMAKGELAYIKVRPFRAQSSRRVKVSDVRKILEGSR